VRQSDIVVENFRPGTLERWGLGWDDLSAVRPDLIMVRISGFGQTGPYATRAGYASIGEAMGGLRALTGYPDRPPIRVGISIGDSRACRRSSTLRVARRFGAVAPGVHGAGLAATRST
jgi:succinyl-CoA---D-citramalate CoA-transferase